MNFLFSDDDDDEKGFPLFLIFFLLLPIATILAVFLIEERAEDETERIPRGRGDREREEPQRERQRQASSNFQAVTDRTTTRQEQRETQKQPKPKPQKEAEKSPAAKSRQQTQGEDKLEVVEGIGPKTAGILRDAGITTLRQLADTSVDRLNEILTGAGLRLNPPDSWPEQARYAADGDWDGLDEFKNRLHAGRA